MSKKEAKQRFVLLLKAGIPYTVAGMVIVLAGIYLIKTLFAKSKYLTVILFLWLAIFWFVYQPMFKKRIQKVKAQLEKGH